MKYLLTPFFCFLSSFVYSQNIIETHLSGTLLLAAKGKDGIILAADSRLNISGNTEDSVIQVAYVDDFKKIYIVNSYAIALAGTAYSRNESVKNILDSFLLSKPQYTDPASFITLLMRYIKWHNTDFYLSVRYKSRMICCGYYNSEQCIAATNGDSVFLIDNYAITSQTNGYFNRNYRSDLTCKKLKELAIATIDSFPILNPDRKYQIGGKTSVLQIKPGSKFKWMTTTKGMVYWNTYKEYITNFLSDRIKAIIIRPDALEPLKEMYRSVLSGEITL